MTSKLVSALALVISLASPGIAAAQDLASQLVGVWQRNESVRKFVEGGEAKPAPVGGVAIFTRGGLFTVTLLWGDRKAPAGPVPTDQELAALAKTSFFGSGHTKSKATLLSFVMIPVPSHRGSARSAGPP